MPHEEAGGDVPSARFHSPDPACGSATACRLPYRQGLAGQKFRAAQAPQERETFSARTRDLCAVCATSQPDRSGGPIPVVRAPGKDSPQAVRAAAMRTTRKRISRSCAIWTSGTCPLFLPLLARTSRPESAASRHPWLPGSPPERCHPANISPSDFYSPDHHRNSPATSHSGVTHRPPFAHLGCPNVLPSCTPFRGGTWQGSICREARQFSLPCAYPSLEDHFFARRNSSPNLNLCMVSMTSSGMCSSPVSYQE